MSKRSLAVGLWMDWGLVASTGLAKVFALVGGQQSLAGPDPLLAIPTADVLWASAVIELVMCAIFITVGLGVRARMLATLGGVFTLYHVFLLVSGYRGPCPCLGSLWEWTGLKGIEVNYVSLALALFLLATGWRVLVEEWRGACAEGGRDGGRNGSVSA